MDAGSVNSTVNTALALQQNNKNQGVQASLLRKSLDSQASQMGRLMSSLEAQPNRERHGVRSCLLRKRQD